METEKIFLTYKSNRIPKQTQTSIFELLWNPIEEKEQTIKQQLEYPQFITILVTPQQIKKTATIAHQTTQLIQGIISLLEEAETNQIGENPKEMYETFRIPKHSGGFREINAPNQVLKEYLRKAKCLFQEELQIRQHNAAYAYIPKRCAKHAIEKHQYNKSKWFLKLDIKDFFTNCKEEFIHNQLKKIFPFSMLYATTEGIKAMNAFIARCTLNGGLPQGTPLSPYLTNILMIPIDYALTSLLKQYDKQYFCYTRYADDLLISSKYDFDWQKIQREVQKILEDTPLRINTQKTRYGSASGRNWNLGLMLNQNNEITIGYKRKREIKQTLLNLCLHSDSWTLTDAQIFQGELAYFQAIEPEYAKYIIQTYEQKYTDNHTIKELLFKILNP